MKTTVLGWGSLIWDPRNLRISGEWRTDGPFLPVEFARVSGDGRLTLVLHPDAKTVQALWGLSTYDTLVEAKKNLMEREGTTLSNIGFVNLATRESRCNTVPDVVPRIEEWAEARNLEAVIWTDLASNFRETQGVELDAKHVIAYLEKLLPDRKASARKYIENAPVQIDTRLGSQIKIHLGWGNPKVARTSKTK